MIDLQRLADVLKENGFEWVELLEEGRILRVRYSLRTSEPASYFDGTEECPALAFAMLDLLDRAKNQFGTRYYFATGATPNVIKDGKSVPREDGMTHYCGSHYGPSRTAAIALCFMGATDAGLISSSVQVENE